LTTLRLATRIILDNAIPQGDERGWQEEREDLYVDSRVTIRLFSFGWEFV